MTSDDTHTPPRGSSPAQVRANQQNAQRSSGPRTAEGKARSAANALKHGIYADSTRAITQGLLGEDPAQVEQFLNSVVDQLAPRNPVETGCATKIATLLLAELRRDRYEADLLTEAGLLSGADCYALGGDPDKLADIIVTLAKAADWGRSHFQQTHRATGQDAAPDDPFLDPPGLYQSMTETVAGLVGEDVHADGIWDPRHEPTTPQAWKAALIMIVDEAFPALEGFLDCIHEATRRARSHRRRILEAGAPLAAARSLTVLERTLTTSERISRQLRSASRLYDALHSQDLPAPDPDQDQLTGTDG